jgi:hypothetical protein
MAWTKVRQPLACEAIGKSHGANAQSGGREPPKDLGLVIHRVLFVLKLSNG